uniref:Uncharacterized protein n=1 Tax=Arundo donax TaxID=35708 RepID=A0A0A9BAP8_ARUDO
MTRRMSPSGISLCRTLRCVTPCPGDSCCCLPYPTTCSPPLKSMNEISNSLRPSLPLLEMMRRQHSEWYAG